MSWEWFELFVKVYFPHLNGLAGIIYGRVFLASLVLSVIAGLIMLVRRKCSPAVRSLLWASCFPVLFIPLERGIVTIARNLGVIAGQYGYFPYPQLFSDGVWQSLLMLVYQPIWADIWLAGFVVCLIVKHRNYRKTVRLLNAGQVTGYAAYFYKGRSRIYTPPDFADAYTDNERGLLLAHERQHISQFDPPLYRILLFIECLFWFNPLVYKAVRLIRHDRELLCDERVTRHCSKKDYGLLLLSEAKKNAPNAGLAGFVSEPTGIYERILACVAPLPKRIVSALLIGMIAASVTAIGSLGWGGGAIEDLDVLEISKFEESEGEQSFVVLEGWEEYISVEGDGYHVDADRLYARAAAEGLADEQVMALSVTHSRRISLFADTTFSSSEAFTVGELMTGEVILTFDEIENDWLIRLYKAL